MVINDIQLPRIASLPTSFPKDGALNMELVEGVAIFRSSKAIQERIEHLLESQQKRSLTDPENAELDQYESIDDYLSYVNQILRNASFASEINETA